MAHRLARPTGLLSLAAVATVLGAVTMDVLGREHPSHTAALGLVAAVVAALRVGLAGRGEGLVSAVSGALVAQPALHATSAFAGPAAPAGPHDHGDLLHVLASDGPVTAMQVLAPALLVLAVVFGARLGELVLGALRRPLRRLTSPPPEVPRRIVAALGPVPRGSLLPWCGWAIRAARRGPPRAPAPTLA
ncbi:hypothetical protein [Pseudonocardia asaccharolytica]|uniref:Uncharacterized protein n=1 Tax=Pseudonocardia asaccharolytica DSM 44247 = NBRC 16224 TaxID=1123024 RepID=A0A511CXZ3_9PSEU|nr:hypothetical protein [Pseudonocardia asaccharolytica]GEL17327.1 hypothetical protein PA7_11640 [Pseudonocardia asaccharolytica DSM 44247 = NBRC 16224]